MIPDILLVLVFCVLYCINISEFAESSYNVPCLTNVKPIRLYSHPASPSTYINNYTYYYFNDETLHIKCGEDNNWKLKWIYPTQRPQTLECGKYWYYMHMKAERNNTNAVCEYQDSRYYNNKVEIRVKFISISGVQYLKLQGLDTKRLQLVSQSYKMIEYIYEFYDGEDVNAMCASDEGHDTLYWEWEYGQGGDRNNTLSEHSPIFYPKKLNLSDDGAHLYCLCWVCKTTKAYFRIQLSFKSPSSYLYKLEGKDNQKRLNQSSVTEYIYKYNDGETISLRCELKDKQPPAVYYMRWQYKAANTTRNYDPYNNYLAINLYNITLTTVTDGDVVCCETYANNAVYSFVQVTFKLITSVNNVDNSTSFEQKSDDNNSSMIGIVISISIVLLVLSLSLLYICRRKRKRNITSVLTTPTSKANSIQTRNNPAYEQSAGSKPPEDVAYEPCYDQIGEVNGNVGLVSYATMQFGNELYAKPTPKALRQNKNNAVYAQVMPKCERDGAKRNDNANEDGGYYNMFENQPYANTKTNKEYAEPCYAECSRNQF